MSDVHVKIAQCENQFLRRQLMLEREDTNMMHHFKARTSILRRWLISDISNGNWLQLEEKGNRKVAVHPRTHPVNHHKVQERPLYYREVFGWGLSRSSRRLEVRARVRIKKFICRSVRYHEGNCVLRLYRRILAILAMACPVRHNILYTDSNRFMSRDSLIKFVIYVLQFLAFCVIFTRVLRKMWITFPGAVLILVEGFPFLFYIPRERHNRRWDVQWPKLRFSK